MAEIRADFDPELGFHVHLIDHQPGGQSTVYLVEGGESTYNSLMNRYNNSASLRAAQSVLEKLPDSCGQKSIQLELLSSAIEEFASPHSYTRPRSYYDKYRSSGKSFGGSAQSSPIRRAVSLQSNVTKSPLRSASIVGGGAIGLKGSNLKASSKNSLNAPSCPVFLGTNTCGDIVIGKGGVFKRSSPKKNVHIGSSSMVKPIVLGAKSSNLSSNLIKNTAKKASFSDKKTRNVGHVLGSNGSSARMRERKEVVGASLRGAASLNDISSTLRGGASFKDLSWKPAPTLGQKALSTGLNALQNGAGSAIKDVVFSKPINNAFFNGATNVGCDFAGYVAGKVIWSLLGF